MRKQGTPGSATLLQLAFVEECDRGFGWKCNIKTQNIQNTNNTHTIKAFQLGGCFGVS